MNARERRRKVVRKAGKERIKEGKSENKQYIYIYNFEGDGGGGEGERHL